MSNIKSHTQLGTLFSWLLKNGFKKEAEAISELTNYPSSFKKQADHPLFSPEYMIDTSEYPYYGESEYFPDVEDNIKSEDIYYGQNVLWIGTPGKMIKADPNYIYPIEGNIFYPEKINDVVNKIVNSDERVMFYAPYGIATKININDISESIQYGGGTNQYSPEVLTTGDEELDEYLEDPEGFFSYYDLDNKDEYEEYLKEKDRIDNEIKDAIKNESGDIGKIMVQIRDGNHRAFGAIAAGEPYIWVAIAENQLQDIKHGIGKDSEDIGSRLASNNYEAVRKNASNDKYIVAATLYEEARNQGEEGMRAVLHVIRNRAMHSGQSQAEICLEPKQFSCWNNRDPYSMDYSNLTDPDKMSWDLAQKIVASPGPDPTRGSTHYFAGEKVPWG